MRFSSTLTAALGVAPLVAAFPSTPREAVGSNGLIPARQAGGAVWSRNVRPEPADGVAVGNNTGVGKNRNEAADDSDDDDVDSDDSDDVGRGAGRGGAGGAGAGRGKDRGVGAGAGAGAGAEAGAGAGEAAEGQEVEIPGVFGQLIDLKGEDLKQDVIFPATAGSFEVEFAAKTARKVAVIENKTPGAPPAGFKLLDPSSFIVTFQGGGRDLTLGQLDFIFDAASPAVAGLDLKTTTIGRFNDEKSIFEVGDRVGETEFEAEENEIVLKVRNQNQLSGEFAVFVPDVAAVEEGAGEGAAEGDEIGIKGQFGTANDVVGGKKKQDLLFPGNAAGEFEVEFNGATANRITVFPTRPAGAAPAGFAFVDPLAFVVSAEGATAADDLLKIDYFFSDAIAARIDVAQGRVGKLDAATGAYVVDGIGEFEFEAEEKEWTLTVTDLNGEWALLVPQAAIRA